MAKRIEDERPDFEGMKKEELIAILDQLRKSLAHCEDADDFVREVADKLKIDLSAGAYES
jgi:hypothetical protein